MGRLSGFRYFEVARRLRKFGFTFSRTAAGSHEIWCRDSDGRKVTVPQHSKPLAEGTLRAILREAGIEVEAFLAA